MKKIISIFMLLACVISFSACSNKQSKDIYQKCAFENLQTFTAYTDIELHSSEETDETTVYKYVVFENSDELINSYKGYLTEYGFTLSSDINSPDMVFELDEKTLTINVTTGVSGTEIKIVVPLDQQTIDENKEKAYQDYLSYFNQGNYSECLEFAQKISLNGYKEFDQMNAYATAEDYMNKGNWLKARFEYEKCSGFKDADTRKAEIEEQLYSLNGIYEFKNDYAQKIYVIISYGRATIKVDSSLFSYKPGDPIDHYSMRVHKGYITKDGLPFINNEYGSIAATNEDGTRVWTPVFVNDSADGTADRIDFVFSYVDGGGMLLTPSGDKYKHMIGVYHKVADIE